MGNACCSEGGNIAENELKNYESRPYNQEEPYHKGTARNDELLMAYSSVDKKKIVKIQSHYRGHATRKRINDGNSIINGTMNLYIAGNLINVHNMRIDEASEESAIYSGQMLKDNPAVK